MAMPLASMVVRLARIIVPADIRRDWLREWEAELAFERGRGRGERRLALRALGAWPHACWLRWDRWKLEMLLQELTHAVRGLLKRPGFTAITVLTLALGIGANAAIFSAVHAVLLRPLPYPEPDRLVRVYKSWLLNANRFAGTTTAPDFVDWQRENRIFTAMGAYSMASMPLTGEGEPSQVASAGVTGGFFPTLGVRPLMGRTILPEDDAVGGPDVVVLSHAMWQRQFGGRSDIVGRRVNLDGVSREVVGVMPAGFAFPQETAAWVPLRFAAETLATQRGAHYLSVVARLRPDASVEAADADMQALAARLAEAFPRTNRDYSSAVQPLRDAMVGSVRPALLVTLAAVGFVLLVVCVNVAGLVVTRTAGRGRELAIRAAVGADRVRLMRGLTIETFVLAAAGAALGLVVAWWGAALVAATDRRVGIPLIEQTAIDGDVVMFTAGIAALAGLLFGVWPAWQASRQADVASRLRGEGAAVTARHATRHTLIVVETAIAVMLLVGAGLLTRSFTEMLDVGLGFETDGIQTAAVSLPGPRYPQPEQRAELFADLLARVRAHPAVRSAGAIVGLPLTGYHFGFSAHSVDGLVLPDDEQDRLSTQLRIVTPGYLEALGMRVIEGRGFTGGDRANTTRVALVSESAARLIWPGTSPIGHHLTIGTQIGMGQRAGGEIVGVVADVHDLGPTVAPRPTLYLAHAQFPIGTMRLALRASGDTSPLVDVLRTALADLDPDLPLYQVQTMSEAAGASVAQPRLLMLLMAIFAGTTLLLAAIGLYGVLAHAVGQRTREIGIRMALGADRPGVIGMIVGQAGRLAAAGVFLGVIGALATGRLLSGLLFGIEPTDPLTYALVVVGLGTVALIASAVPALRAASVDPATALRSE